MTTSSWNDFEQRVSSEENLHVDSEPLVWPPSQAQLLSLAERNANTLAAIAALEERRADGGDDDSPLMQEMLRMDAKLTALVDIVNHLLVPTDTLPPRQSLRFNAVGALLPAALVPPGDALLLRLRFDLCRSMPLVLAARVERQFDDGRVFVVFAPHGDVQSDAIERLVFRHHRRKVAECASVDRLNCTEVDSAHVMQFALMRCGLRFPVMPRTPRSRAASRQRFDPNVVVSCGYAKPPRMSWPFAVTHFRHVTFCRRRGPQKWPSYCSWFISPATESRHR